MKIIINENLYLKTPVVGDAKQLYELISIDRDYLLDIFNFVTMSTTLNDVSDLMIKLSDSRFVFNIFSDNSVCGIIDVYHYNVIEKSYEIRYYLGSKYRGKGIIEKVLNKFIDYIFETFDVEKIKFYINTSNIPSNKIAKKLKLKYIKTILANDYCNNKYHDQNLYEISKNT